MGYFSHPARLPLITSLIALSWSTGAQGFSQRDAQVQSNNVSLDGSDRSMELATGSAMTALLSLSAANIPAAVTNGYRAYGQYMDAETLDHRAGVAARQASALTSLGNAAPTIPGSDRSANKTSFRRLNPKFLYKGETAEIAKRFEAATGMKREDFLGFLAKASETKIAPDDPQLLPKTFGMLQDFVNQIPNEEFRGKLQGTLDTIPDTAKSGIVATAITRAIQMIAQSSGGATGTGTLAGQQASGTNATAPVTTESAPHKEASVELASSENRAPANAEAPPNAPMAPGLVLTSLNSRDHGEVNAFFGAPAAAEEKSIFTLVSNCYRRSVFFQASATADTNSIAKNH